MIELKQVPPAFIDRAWRDGAHKLAEACDTSGGEITGDQLKMILSRGERTLLAMQREGEFVGWGVVRLDQLPNIRVLHVSELYAPGARFEEFMEPLKAWAESNGCSRIRCSAKPAQAKLYRDRAGFKPVYETLEVLL